ncbi:hypothetical protein HK104_011125 [Borealophlyctis nickersoniae]|nr:hypothetical protein HK104_011125 [Borealophlyctis nickersoniae]
MSDKVQQIMDQVRKELALQNFRELLRVRLLFLHKKSGSVSGYWAKTFSKQQIEEKCYAKCVPSPGTKLSDKEQLNFFD